MSRKASVASVPSYGFQLSDDVTGALVPPDHIKAAQESKGGSGRTPYGVRVKVSPSSDAQYTLPRFGWQARAASFGMGPPMPKDHPFGSRLGVPLPVEYSARKSFARGTDSSDGLVELSSSFGRMPNLPSTHFLMVTSPLRAKQLKLSAMNRRPQYRMHWFDETPTVDRLYGGTKSSNIRQDLTRMYAGTHAFPRDKDGKIQHPQARRLEHRRRIAAVREKNLQERLQGPLLDVEIHRQQRLARAARQRTLADRSRLMYTNTLGDAGELGAMTSHMPQQLSRPPSSSRPNTAVSQRSFVSHHSQGSFRDSVEGGVDDADACAAATTSVWVDEESLPEETRGLIPQFPVARPSSRGSKGDITNARFSRPMTVQSIAQTRGSITEPANWFPSVPWRGPDECAGVRNMRQEIVARTDHVEQPWFLQKPASTIASGSVTDSLRDIKARNRRHRDPLYGDEEYSRQKLLAAGSVSVTPKRMGGTRGAPGQPPLSTAVGGRHVLFPYSNAME